MTTTPRFRDSQQRHVVSTFRYVDKLLAEAEQIMASAESPSPFQEFVADSTPIQRKLAHDYIVRIRQTMRRILDELQAPLPPANISALWGARTHVLGAAVAVEELAPQYLRGYGELSSEQEQAAAMIVSELRNVLDQLNRYLAQPSATDLQGRLQRLPPTSAAVPLLCEIERVITAHGLVEFRPALEWLMDRLENRSFEIGIFGRVNSGKSSLLNHLLQADVLPVGVTPVTAIPTRIRYGPQSQARIEFAENPAQSVKLARLAAFATEQQNPANVKNVTRIEVQLPSARLRDGVVFVDTPGLGSLAVAGAEETHAYLPRCDLGVVLVDAASALTHEDLALALALCQAGANAMILISKADLLNPAERQRTSDYVREHLQIETRLDLPIRLLSVVGADAALCDRWFEEDLRPLLDKHQELADASHRRKIALLRESVAAVLQQRLQTTRPPAAGDHAHRIQAAGEALRRARQALESNRRRADDLARAITALADRILETAAGQIADAWRVHSAPPDAAASVTSSAATVVAGQTGQILGLIEETREQLSEALRQAAGVALAAHDTLEPLPKPAGLPANDFSATRAKVDLEAAGHWRWFGRALLRARLLEELQEQIGDALRAHLRLHSQRLVSWAAQAFAELEIGFTARAEIYHAQFAVLQHSAVPATPAAVVAGDLQSLQQWSPDVSGNKESNLA